MRDRHRIKLTYCLYMVSARVHLIGISIRAWIYNPCNSTRPSWPCVLAGVFAFVQSWRFSRYTCKPIPAHIAVCTLASIPVGHICKLSESQFHFS